MAELAGIAIFGLSIVIVILANRLDRRIDALEKRVGELSASRQDRSSADPE